jgi:mono/diheme cytochrome c family protein
MKNKICRWAAGVSSLSLVTAALALGGCSTPAQPGGAGAPAATAATSAPVGVSGAKLWAQNCGRCHNIRSPDSQSDAQWDVVMLHMRVRANLTAQEHREILAFLKSAH